MGRCPQDRMVDVFLWCRDRLMGGDTVLINIIAFATENRVNDGAEEIVDWDIAQKNHRKQFE